MLIVIAALIALVSAGSMFTLDLPAQGQLGLWRGNRCPGAGIRGSGVAVRTVVLQPPQRRGSRPRCWAWPWWSAAWATSWNPAQLASLVLAHCLVHADPRVCGSALVAAHAGRGLALLITLAAMTLQSPAATWMPVFCRNAPGGPMRPVIWWGPLSLGFRFNGTSNLTCVVDRTDTSSRDVWVPGTGHATRSRDLPHRPIKRFWAIDQAVQGYPDLAMTTMACGAAALAVALASRYAVRKPMPAPS